MAVPTASKSRPALGRRPMPTNVIPLAGFPSPRQFISISPHFPKAGMWQQEAHVNHSCRAQLVVFLRNSRWPQRRTEMGDALGATTADRAGESALAMQQQRAVRSCCRSASRRVRERNCPLGWPRTDVYPTSAKSWPIPRQSVETGSSLTAMRRLFPEMSDECLVYLPASPLSSLWVISECRGQLREQGCACLRPSPCAGLLVAKAHEGILLFCIASRTSWQRGA